MSELDGPDLVVAGAGGGLVAALRGGPAGLSRARRGAQRALRRGQQHGDVDRDGARRRQPVAARGRASTTRPRRFLDDIRAKTARRGRRAVGRGPGRRQRPAGRVARRRAGPAPVAGHRLPLPRALGAALPHRAGPVGTSPARRPGPPGAPRGAGRPDGPGDDWSTWSPTTDGVAGVVAETPNGQERIPTRAVLLATNGFGADDELVREHLPEIAGAVYHGSEGSPATRCGSGRGSAPPPATSTPTRATPPWPMPAATLAGWATVMHGGFLVDAAGRRFGDETTGYSEYAAGRAARGRGRGLGHARPADPRGLPARSRTSGTPSSPAPSGGATPSRRSPAAPAWTPRGSPRRSRRRRAARPGSDGPVRPHLLGGAARAAVRDDRGPARPSSTPRAGCSSTRTPASSTTTDRRSPASTPPAVRPPASPVTAPAATSPATACSRPSGWRCWRPSTWPQTRTRISAPSRAPRSSSRSSPDQNMPGS